MNASGRTIPPLLARLGLRTARGVALLSLPIFLWNTASANGAERPTLPFQSLPLARYHFEGPLGLRIAANVEHWLLPAPESNPGMIQMFHLRDRLPVPKLVPWAGEFVGKYLISAIQALRMTNDPKLRARVARTIEELLATQAEDGYLGPFPQESRLKGNWDLWGHYHIMLALLMWHEAAGDAAALQACQRAADLVCATFLDSPLRVRDAGSPEMNMAILHSLAKLYRLTGLPRYLRMVQEIEKDWETAGDYFRTGLQGVEFHKTPKPRWESLHSLQGLVELYRITGDARYRTAFTNHWWSIQRFDRRNSGAFSSGEQATGNPYAPTVIETCCTIAWIALTIDMLQLTGDSRAADELELSTFNAAAGAQHPSGRWWTYNTPMDGVREASAHSIVFQARAGTPELNCCSVNGPRGLGALSEWAVMQTSDGLAVNHFGPGSFQGKLPDQTPVALAAETDYPVSGRVQLRVEPLAAREFNLRLRIPAWSRSTVVRVNRTAVADVFPGTYLDLKRRWRAGDRVTLTLDLSVRAVAGEREAAGRVSLYRGPVLLAYDQRHNSFDETAIPPADLDRLGDSKLASSASDQPADSLTPWLLLNVPAADSGWVRLCDFASAGSAGTAYRSWLPASSSARSSATGVTPPR